MALALLTTGFYIVLDGSRVLGKIRTAINKSYSLLQVREQIISSLNADDSFSKIVNANADMNCLKTRTDCSAKKNAAWKISVISSDAQVLTDPSNPSQGFTMDGRVCTGFDPGVGNPQCPFRFEVTWEPICQAGLCANPQNRLVGILIYNNPAKKNDFDVNRLGFTVFSTLQDSTIDASCATLNGSYDSINGTCVLPLAGFCPKGQIVVGIDDNNNKICKPLYNQMCPPGTRLAIDGTTATGTLICKNIAYCPPKTFFRTWRPWVPGWGETPIQGDGCDGKDGSDGGS